MMIRALIALFAALSFSTPAFATPHWAQLAIGDVERLHQSVIDFHPGMRDPETPDFAARVELAYQTAKARAAAARSYADWLAATQGYMVSFRDGHTIFRPNLNPTRARWPGFLIDGQGGGWVVRRPAGSSRNGIGPEDGARIVSCNGMPIADLLESRLDGVVADWSKEPERIRQAFNLFIDTTIDGPTPLSQCTFALQGKVETQTLGWTIEPWSALSAGFAPFMRQVRRPIAVRALPSGGQWVSLGSFGDETKLEALAQSLEADPAKLRNAPFIVFDLRGNRGGNSTWGERFAKVLWGDAAVTAKTDEIDRRPGRRAGKYWRGSAQVAVAARVAAAEFKAQGPDFAEVAAYWFEVADRIIASPDGDRALVYDPCCDAVPPGKPAIAVPNIYRNPAYVLIDAGCFSSCVLAANRLVEQGAIAVGETSGQNEEYGEIATPPPLPSGLARYFLPISIIRQPSETLRVVPEVRWDGAMDADREIERWIERMAAGTTP